MPSCTTIGIENTNCVIFDIDNPAQLLPHIVQLEWEISRQISSCKIICLFLRDIDLAESGKVYKFQDGEIISGLVVQNGMYFEKEIQSILSVLRDTDNLHHNCICFAAIDSEMTLGIVFALADRIRTYYHDDVGLSPYKLLSITQINADTLTIVKLTYDTKRKKLSPADTPQNAAFDNLALGMQQMVI
ncbi:MAG: hypothetical protein M0R33_18825 [Methylomonas sp.]|nr:hypothetical protein [Methylomonas sp.]